MGRKTEAGLPRNTRQRFWWVPLLVSSGCSWERMAEFTQHPYPGIERACNLGLPNIPNDPIIGLHNMLNHT